jgi:serine/threonine-protein kinase
MDFEIDGGFGDFEVIRRDRVESFFEVYRAQRDDEVVEIEWLFDAVAADPRAQQLLDEEAAIQRAARDPRITELVATGVRLARPWRAFSRPQGATLEALLRKERELEGTIPEEIVIALARESALAVHALHTKTRGDRGICFVHRSIDAAHLFVTYTGRVQIWRLDIARREFMKGGIRTLSPEQAQGDPLDERSDLFSLAGLWFEIVTGEHPFQRESVLAELRAVIEDPAPRLDHPLGSIIARLLQKDRERRYPTAAALLEALPESAADVGSWARAILET